MEATTDNLLTPFQKKQLAERAETLEPAFQILNSGRALGLDMLDLDVLGGSSLWATPNEREPILDAYAHLGGVTSDNLITCGPRFTVLRYDSDHNPVERLLLAVGVDRRMEETKVTVMDRTEAEVLSPADTAIELTEEDVEPLERVSRMFGPLQVPAELAEEEEQGGTLPFLRAVLGEPLWMYSWGNGITENSNSTIYVVADEVGNVKAIRPNGTILPVGQAASEPSELDGEREEIIRPRLEELRA